MLLQGRLLLIAGSDSGGGAGIQADLKTATAFGAYAATAITALTAQDTTGVRAVHPVPPDFIALQIRMALADPGADVIKTGMLGDAATIDAVCAALSDSELPLVADPVMQAKGGAALLAPASLGLLRTLLLPRVTLLTPNLPEAEALTGRTIADVAAMEAAAARLMEVGAPAVLLKGGHLPGEVVVDILATPAGVEHFTAPRLPGRHTHGTGCTLATAIAAGLAQRLSLRDAVVRARAYVYDAIASAPGFGLGHGPLNHAVWSYFEAPGAAKHPSKKTL
jgi:hydroxymethylpyrimidine/phosphomethylpyrimidine kinase